MNFFRILIAVSIVGFHFDAIALEGDTKISVSYKTKTVRVKPSPQNGGGVTDIRVILHRDGTVDDAYNTPGGPQGSSQSKLGSSGAKARFKVMDGTTLVRVDGNESYVHKTTIKVNGKNCTADVERSLKPGHKLFKVRDSAAKKDYYYSSIENEYITCVIE